jgi:putative endonuclease
VQKQLFVYILRCRDDSYYVGVTNNLEGRFEEHQQGNNPTAYTFTRRPVQLVYYETFSNPEEAIDFEKQLKGWSRKKKEALIENNWLKLKELSICRNTTHYLNSAKSVPENGQAVDPDLPKEP